MEISEANKLSTAIESYCLKYSVPIEYFLDILEDQKVIPMIRGKAMEYNAYLILKSTLSSSSWSVQKLNLNAQPGSGDEDISITHRRTGIILKIESKSAVRGSFRDGAKSKVIHTPHFKVKCHRSRSNISLANSSNDKYREDDFDVIITNPLNALYKGNTISENFELINQGEIRTVLFDFYACSNEVELVSIISKDWRFVFPSNIAIDGFIPRTPYVKLFEDVNWHPITELETKLLNLVEHKWSLVSARRT